MWRSFFNKELCWPQETCYIGEWQSGMRHGKGLLKLGSPGGAKFSGEWKEDAKHGYGLIIGNNGAFTEADPLFLENAIVPLESSNESSARKLDNDRATIDTISPSEYDGVYFEPEPRRMPDPRATTVLKAEQCPLLWFHVYRLLEPEYIWPLSLCTSSSGKCHVCDSDSCICRVPADKEMSSTATGSRNLTSREAQTSKTSQLINKSSRSESSVFVPGKGGTAFIVQCSNENVSPKTNDHQYEERWLYNYLTANMSSLREIYQTYAEAFSSAPPKCDLCMSRLALWQLWRDCGIHDKGISLVQIDCYIAFNKSTFVEEKHNPFEKLEIWQFIHALLEVAWHIYTKYMDSETENIRGRLAGGLHKLLTIDILPNFGNHVGTLTSVNRNLLPLYAVFRLYESIGNPHTVLQFLRSTCIIKGTSDPEPKSWAPKITTFPDFLLDGRNVVTVGERVSYLPKEAPFNVPKVPKPVEKKDQDRLAQELFALRWLGAPRMVEVIAHVCPSIKDPQSGIIVNISYELTFLEFYEIILEASRRFLYARRIEEMKIEKQAEASAPDTALDENTTNGILQGNSNQHSAASKRSRPKKKFQ
ncbi:radial spoke head 10 homolog B-like [Orussus abietinus]|uniref:radial spoke head 10 homolog B-like n=1 Tax=Orussus abietinus TaxID=222816 RepID=UPI000C716198|nr:radial spoke head 10 homolog B-like [Orussus abietinus]